MERVLKQVGAAQGALEVSKEGLDVALSALSWGRAGTPWAGRDFPVSGTL